MSNNIFGVSARLVRYVIRKVLRVKVAGYRDLRPYFENLKGLEIGGPSDIFSSGGFIPLYNLASTIDGCNFSTNTLWERGISPGAPYMYHKHKLGKQYILEASDLEGLNDGTYDFVISSHSLEHIANPLKALNEWTRVLKKSGVLLVIVPDKRCTFDHKRPTTLFQHLVTDFETNVGEDDLSHLDEIFLFHDLNRDPGAGDMENFKKRSFENLKYRGLHHHVFDMSLLKEIYLHLNLTVHMTAVASPHHLIIVGIKEV